MKVQVPYKVALEVVVDLDTGEVCRVVEIGESIELSLENGVHSFDEFVEIKDEKIIERAVKIADENEWPNWEFGW